MTTRTRTLTVLPILVLLTSASPLVAAPKERIHLVVRLYDSAGITPAVLRAALGDAAGILRGANVDVAWVPCIKTASTGAPPPCSEPLPPGHLTVRVVRDASLPRRVAELPLGFALIDPQRGEGTLATVFLDRVLWLAHSAGVDPATLLARAMAHEIGHLLIGSDHHSSRGLLRAVWRRDEVRHGRAADWRFTVEDGNEMRAAFLQRLQRA
jgi:hypothetical protein